MRNYHIAGLPGLFTYLEVVQRVQNGRTPAPPAPAVAPPVLNGDAMIRAENDPVGSEVRLDQHPDFVAVFPRPAPAPAVPTTTTTPTLGNGRGWLRAVGTVLMGLLGIWLLFFVLIPGLFAIFGSPNLGWSKGAIAQAQFDADVAKQQAADAKAKAADAQKAADEAKQAAAIADAKAKGASIDAQHGRLLAQVNLCPGGNKSACVAMLKADGQSDEAAAEACAPTCVSATTP